MAPLHSYVPNSATQVCASISKREAGHRVSSRTERNCTIVVLNAGTGLRHAHVDQVDGMMLSLNHRASRLPEKRTLKLVGCPSSNARMAAKALSTRAAAASMSAMAC